MTTTIKTIEPATRWEAMIAKRTGTCTLRFPGAVTSVVSPSGAQVTPSPLGANCRRVALQAGETMVLEVKI